MARPNAPGKASSLRLVVDASVTAPDRASPEDRLDDRQLAACIRAGDDGAARTLHDRVRPRVDVTIRSLLGHGDPDHEDLVQLSMMALVEGIDRYRGDCSLPSWASLIAARAVYKEIRRRRRARRVFDPSAADGLADELAESPASMVRALDARSVAARLRTHLDRLGEDKAWTFLLHDVCGFTLDEIATITEASSAAAQKRLVRARHELFERCAGDPELADLVQGRDAQGREDGR